MQTPLLPPPERFRFEAATSTRWSDEDNQGVPNNAVYLTLLEEARLAYFGRLGLLEAGQFPFVLAQCNLRFLRPGRGGEQWRVAVATTRLGTSSFEQAYRILGADGQPVAEAEAWLVGWDNARRQKCALSAAFRSRVAALEGLEAGPSR
jgi:acyl-CoA thioester hydrolase